MRTSSPISENPVVLTLPVTHAVKPQRVTSLLSNVSWMLSANIVQVAVQFGMLLALTRFSDLATVGRFAYASAIVNPIMLLAQMQLRNVQIVDVGHRFSFLDYFTFRAMTTAIALCILIAISLIHAHNLAAVILALAVVRVADAISDIFQGALQQSEKFRPLGISSILRSFTGGVGFVTAIAYSQDLNTGILLLAITSLTITIGLDIPLGLIVWRHADQPARGLPGLGRFRNILKLAVTALPLGCATFLSATEANLPRYFLSAYATEEALGVFSTIVACANLGAILINAMAQSVVPRLARLLHAGEMRAFRNFVGGLVLCGLAIGLVALLTATVVGKQALTLVLGSYEPSYLTLLLIILGGVTFCYMHIFIGTALMAANLLAAKFRLQLAATFSSALFLVLMTPTLQLHGAALALLGTSAISVLLHAAVFFGYVRSRTDVVLETEPMPAVQQCA